MKKHWAVVLPLLVVGCAPEDKDGDGIVDGVREPDSVSVVAPANPKGTVSGQVLDTRMAPLADADVKLTIGSATAEKPFDAKTDASGNFVITSVPAGAEVLVTVSKQGYATLRASAVVPSHAGNIPINNGNANIGAIALAQTQSSVSFTLLTPAGNPARGAKAYLEATPAGTIAYNGGSASAVSSVVASAEADALGVVTFSNVPAPAELARIGGVGAEAGGYRLWVDPVDSNGDGIVDAAGYSGKIDASTLMVSGGSQLLRLPAPRNSDGDGSSVSGFQLLATNVPSLHYVKLVDGDPAKAQMELQRKPMRNLVKPGEPIYLGFSQPVARESLLAIVVDEFGRDRTEVSVTSSAAGDVYTLTPQATLREGVEYNLILRATSAYDGTLRSWKGYFISGDPKTPRPLSIFSAVFKDGTTGTVGTLDPGECIILGFNQDVTPSGVQFDVAVSSGEANPPVYKALPAAPPTNNSCFSETATNFPIDSVNFNQATSRYYITYTGPALNLTTTPVTVKADFTTFQSSDLSAYYETSWGAPVSWATKIEKPLARM